MATSDWKIIGRVALQELHWPSKTRHTINGLPCRQFTRLEIATYDEESGFYLLHIDSDDKGADTWHRNLGDAFHQAEFEFGVRRDEWQMEVDTSPKR